MKHIINKYSKGLIGLAIFFGGIITIYAIVQTSTELRFDDQLTTQFGSGIFNYGQIIDFSYGGNKKIGMYLPRSIETLASPEVVVLDGSHTGLCYEKIRGVYYNNQRGERVWPLDYNTLTGLQSIDSSYNGMQLSGGLFTTCSGSAYDSGAVYGQLTINGNNTTYYLIAGTNYNFTGNTHGMLLTGSLQRRNNNNINGYIWDSYGGIGLLVYNAIYQGPTSLTGAVNTGETVTLPDKQTTIYTSGSNNSLVISGTQFVVTGSTWNGIILPPTPAVGTGAANTGETGLSTGNIYFSIQVGATGASLISSGSIFIITTIVPLGQVGQTVNLYRSQDGITRTSNTPDTTCTLDSNKYCSFKTDHLSFFAGVYASTTTIITTGPTSSQGGGTRLIKDDCTLTTSTHNLSGANKDGIDYSPSYYDRDCTGPKSTVKTTPINVCVSYSSELNGAFAFARNFDITTINTCTKANINGNLIRKDLAKMMVNFAENVFGRTGILIDSPKCASFSDVSGETSETKKYIKKICEYGLMGLESDGVSPQEKFNPYGVVNRAQFGTILSRFIRVLDYNVGNDSKIPYYTRHLEALQKARIMNKISNPDIKEIRGWVMLTMKRIYEQVK